MTGAEVQAQFFSPFHFFLYMALVLVIMTIFYQWQWSKKCNGFVKVLVVKPDGSTDTEYAPKSGGYVALQSKESNTTRLWPINKLCAIEMLYPGDGFIPEFMQKKIKTVIMDNEDWEPLLNRGSYVDHVASPDVVKALRDLSDRYPDAAEDLMELADSLSTAPTRDMVASPAVLGNVMKERVSELAVNLSRDAFDKFDGIMRRLEKLPNSLIIYIGLGLILICVLVLLFKILPIGDGLANVADMAANIKAIAKALGVAVQNTVPTIPQIPLK
jgi:hypothetical protein